MNFVAADKKIYITSNDQEYIFDYHKTRGPVAHVARVETTTTIYPGKGLTWPVPEQYKEFSHLFFQPRSGTRSWFEPNVEQIQEGNITLKNTSHEPVTLKRGRVFADIRMVDILDPVRASAQLKKERDIPVEAVFSQYPDQQQYKSSAFHKLPQADHTSKIKLDPNNILSPSQVAETRRLCQDFKDVIRPEPGLYNGHYGHIDNKLEFKDKPPPTTRIHQQSLSEDMKRILGEKMDQLHDWGVLQYPEHVGVRPVVVSPSMLVPKAEPGQFRLVTNTAFLNTFLRQPPSSTPSIQEAKDFLATKNFHIHADLSNWFYQSGMERQDIQYLATLHPYKGLMVYCCEPMGLLGAPEHSYEKLARIFGDLIAKGECTRMADGLHIGNNTVEGALATFMEVLSRLRKCNLTIKPSKLEMFPTKTTLFGWLLEDGLWKPTVHTTSALATVPLPKTVKMLRSFLGSFKQFSSCVPRYGEILTSLEALTGGQRKSAERESRDSTGDILGRTSRSASTSWGQTSTRKERSPLSVSKLLTPGLRGACPRRIILKWRSPLSLDKFRPSTSTLMRMPL